MKKEAADRFLGFLVQYRGCRPVPPARAEISLCFAAVIGRAGHIRERRRVLDDIRDELLEIGRPLGRYDRGTHLGSRARSMACSGSMVSSMRSRPTWASHSLKGSALGDGMDWMMRRSCSVSATSVK